MVKTIKSRILNDERKKLKYVMPGDTFKHCGYEWIVLEHNFSKWLGLIDYNPTLTLALSKNIIGELMFDENGDNNWSKSSLCKFLNGEFLDKICGEVLPVGLGFSTFENDLTADDGLKDYQSSLNTISLLTCDLYRQYRDVITPVDKRWWLATPYSTRDDYSKIVCGVSEKGTICRNNTSFAFLGVRPICLLSPETFVRVEQEK